MNFSAEHIKYLSEKATKNFKNKKLSQEQKDLIGKGSKEVWKNPKHKEKMHNMRMGHSVSIKTREKIRKKNIGITRPYVTLYNQTRIPPSGWKHTEEWKNEQRKRFYGENNGMYGKKPVYGKPYPFKDINERNFIFRSSWEKLFAEWLDKNKIIWEYELMAYPLSNGYTYRPDFFTTNTIYEIKGYKHKISMEKFYSFIKEYPNIKIQLIDRTRMKELGLLKY
jgi:hypothetical protein